MRWRIIGAYKIFPVSVESGRHSGTAGAWSIIHRPYSTSLGLAFSVAMTSQADRSPAQHLGLGTSGYKLNAAISQGERRRALAVAEGSQREAAGACEHDRAF
jgi:hypothetical protein